MAQTPKRSVARSGPRTAGRAGPEVAAASTCGCAVTTGNRKAVRVDPTIKAQNLNRLRRIEGQIRGLQRLVHEDRYCADILMQISSVQQALRAVGRQLLRNHLRHCVKDAIQNGPDHAEPVFEELLLLFDRHS